MKIKISYLAGPEERDAGAALAALRSLFPGARVKRGEKDGRSRIFFTTDAQSDRNCQHKKGEKSHP